MKVLIYILFTALLGMLAFESEGQQILLVQKTGRFKNVKFFEGDDIIVRAKGYNKRISGTLEAMTDSSIIIDFDKEIMLADIDKILIHRFWFGLLSKVSRIAGAGYVAIEAVNNLINANPTIVHEKTIMTGAGLVAFSYAIVPLHYRHIKMGKKWKIMVLDLSPPTDVPNPFLR